MPPPIPVFAVRKWNGPGGTKLTSAERETNKAVAFYSERSNYIVNGKRKSFKFTVYSNKDIRRELTIIFHQKCAYCESKMLAVAPADIEHFRPKSEIDTGAGTPLVPGYYWLAADWSNLLLSCPHCNRTSYHELAGTPHGKKVKQGKLTQFPLSDGRRRTRKHTGRVEREEPYRLLLNPCLDSPEEHLVFKKNGIVMARKRKGSPSKMGTTSIDVFALQRMTLVDERTRTASDAVAALSNLEYAASQHRHAAERGDPAGLDEHIRAIDRNLGTIVTMLMPESPYLALVRHIVRTSNRRCKAAQGYGIDLLELVRQSERKTGG